ncbi:HsdM family class I SAM-dependent methyltransferase [Deminuibacter soli]|uniref:site-specific DNA-methyltransferase (adenine-specific) n=1 Tax=Deminuibacter soli TaxID=2291815 RepID=A0A3E1NP31_9BACT|nr:class I SAM-dependent DNA methyltransferase [Deminuibacter soli]RFM29682.1 SAM-dependent DNA methyltransferase [Deminuibacter soli]
MTDLIFITQTKQLIDSLKSVCANFGLGNDGNEFKIITQLFLYRYINDKFSYEARKQDETLAKAEDFQAALEAMHADDFTHLVALIGSKAPALKPGETVAYLYNRQGQENFASLFDATLQAISVHNAGLFSITSAGGAKDSLFDQLSLFIADTSQRDAFCRSLISRLAAFSFEKMLGETYDFFATIFEYLIKDYNSDSGGKYAEYYTPHAAARIMAAIMVPGPVKHVTCYDPSAGSGTLLLNIAHAIGENNCTIYSEDISQKAAGMLRLNLLLNNLSRSIPNIVKTNTIAAPYYLDKKFDYIVSNPPFKLDFSDFRNNLLNDNFKDRFFAGVPNVPKSRKEAMAIYLLFIQHIMYSLSEKGKAAVIVPTGFITARGGMERNIREALIERNMLRGVVSMPGNMFASTGTNVSVLFIDKNADAAGIVLVDASALGNMVKDGKNQRTVLSAAEEQRIITAMNEKQAQEHFSAVVTAADIRNKNYTFAAGQFFDVKTAYVPITAAAFQQRVNDFSQDIDRLFAASAELERAIKQQLEGLRYA